MSVSSLGSYVLTLKSRRARTGGFSISLHPYAKGLLRIGPVGSEG